MSTAKITGGCLCGAITYSIDSDPIRMAKCHCKACQRTSGVGHMALAFFPTDKVTINGSPASYSAPADSGNTNTRSFCATCGSRLFGSNSARAGVMAVTVGSADDNSWFSPQAVVYESCRPVYEAAAEGIPVFAEMPPPQG